MTDSKNKNHKNMSSLKNLDITLHVSQAIIKDKKLIGISNALKICLLIVLLKTRNIQNSGRFD